MPWPVIISMSRTGSRLCAMTRAPSSTALRLPCRRQGAQAAKIGTSRLVKGDTSDVVIEVRDEQNQRSAQ